MTLDIKLGKYTLLEEIGRGGYGTVYRARDEALQVERAVKVLHPALVADPAFIERFREEARLVARLKHPRIAPVYDLDEDQGRIYLTMEYLPGGSLKDVIARESALPYERALAIFKQIADALEYAHSLNLVHRDIKPGNILLDSQGNAYLTDFGFAKSLASADSSTTMTMTGGILGTPAYMAPETWDGKGWTPAADVYSLACVFFEMLMGRPLFDGDTPTRLMKQHIIEGPQFPETWPEGIPAGLTNYLNKALIVEPSERYLTAYDFYAAVEIFKQKPTDLETGFDGDATQPQPDEIIPDWPKLPQNWVNLGIFVVLIVLIGMGLGFVVGRRARTPDPTLTLASELIESAEPVPDETQTPVGTRVTADEGVVTKPATTPARTQETPETIAEPKAGDSQLSAVDGMVQIYIPPGMFLMGSDDAPHDESPQHTISIDAYWIDQAEVTVAQYQQFVLDTGHILTSCGGAVEHPVACVTWIDAQAYCEWAGRRLPTEAEWEKAARGVDGRLYPWGNNLYCTFSNYKDCAKNASMPVGSYPEGSSPYGVLDMAGNVWEWVADWYAGDIYLRGSRGEYYAYSPSVNPTGPTTGESKVVRGGSWNEPAYALQTYNRMGIDPQSENDDLGFRCAMDAEPDG
jgi:eukaryotic-like serine/threonine-protein kinase